MNIETYFEDLNFSFKLSIFSLENIEGIFQHKYVFVEFFLVLVDRFRYFISF